MGDCAGVLGVARAELAAQLLGEKQRQRDRRTCIPRARTVADERAELDRLKAGERVAVDGAQFLRDGSVVAPKPVSPTKKG